MSNTKQGLRKLPSVDRVLREAPQLISNWGHGSVATAIRNELDQIRGNMESIDNIESIPTFDQIIRSVESRLKHEMKSSLVNVLNLTGTVLHTNLGRASLPQRALDAVVSISKSPSNLEYRPLTRSSVLLSQG